MSCGKTGGTANDEEFEQLASGICVCAQPMIEFNTRLRQQIESGNKGEITRLLPMAQHKGTIMIDCCQNQRAQFPALEVDKEKLETALNKSCPALPDLILKDILIKLEE